MTGSLDQRWERQDARGASRPRSAAAAIAGLLPPTFAFVVMAGMTWTLLNGPVESSDDPCARCPTSAAVLAGATQKKPAPPPVPVRGPHLRIALYDPALEPFVEHGWDPQQRTGPEAPMRSAPGLPWIRLSPLDVADREACLVIADRHLGCVKLPRRSTRAVMS